MAVGVVWWSMGASVDDPAPSITTVTPSTGVRGVASAARRKAHRPQLAKAPLAASAELHIRLNDDPRMVLPQETFEPPLQTWTFFPTDDEAGWSSATSARLQSLIDQESASESGLPVDDPELLALAERDGLAFDAPSVADDPWRLLLAAEIERRALTAAGRPAERANALVDALHDGVERAPDHPAADYLRVLLVHEAMKSGAGGEVNSGAQVAFDLLARSADPLVWGRPPSISWRWSPCSASPSSRPSSPCSTFAWQPSIRATHSSLSGPT
jgi:hypothetical protein